MTGTSGLTGTWCAESAPIASTINLRGVWAISAEDVFAVGDGGTILRRTGGAWTEMASGTTSKLLAVWGSSGSDVWAVGVSGTVLHFDGTAWSTLPSFTTSDLDAVWGSGSSDVWLAATGTLWHSTGSGAPPVASLNVGGHLLSVSGTGPTDVWTVGENAGAHHFTGSWVTVSIPSGTNTYFAVLDRAAGDVWVTDSSLGKESMHLVGTTWAAQKVALGVTLVSLTALAASDVWGVGGTRVAHWNGSSWASDTTFGTSASLKSVTSTTGDAWLVGNSALIAHQTL
ncbi:MAG TPA: hypothetical protein VFT22_05425 [Kofleriaceae bacterium]|nr:hypothetical protein [Kofleriaceae bacterium]